MQNVYNKGETGALAITIDPEWNQGKKYVYVYYGSNNADGRKAGMVLSRFEHAEETGGVSSRAPWGSKKLLWHDSDGWGRNPQWHYGGSLQFALQQPANLVVLDK